MIKILVVGNPGVGKSTLINQISKHISTSSLSAEKYSPDRIRLYRALNTTFGFVEVSTLEGLPEDVVAKQKNVDGILFVYDNGYSFADLSEWIEKSKNCLPLTIPRFLVFNKKNSIKNIDLQETSSTLHSFEVNALDENEVQSLFAKLILEINKNTDEEMAKSKSDDERLFYREILAIKKENKEITEKMGQLISKDEMKEFQLQAEKVLEEFRSEGKALIKETQEFLIQFRSSSRENLTPRLTSLPAIEFQETAQLPSVFMNKSKSVSMNKLGKENILPNSDDISVKQEIRLIWDTINTIIGNTHDQLEKIRHEINCIHNNRKENFHLRSSKEFLEKEIPQIITRVKDQVHNHLIGVQKEFEDKIIILEDNFLSTKDELKKTLEEINPVENLEDMIQSFQSPFLRIQKDEFPEKTKPKEPSVQSDFEVFKEESLPSLWATLDIIAIRLNSLERKITC